MVFNSDIRNGFIQYGQSLQSLSLLTGNLNGQTELLAHTIQNLSPKQQALALATKGVSQETIAEVLALNGVEEKQIQQVLLDSAIIQKKKELTKAYALEAITAQGLSTEKASEIMTSAGIVAGDANEVISKKKVNVATLEAKLAQERLSATQIKAITTQLGLGTSTLTLSNYFKGLGISIATSTKAMAAFLFTNPMGWLTLVGTTLAGIIALVNKYNQSQEELRQKAEETAQEYENEIESLKNLKDQYLQIIDSDKTSIEKTEELNEWKKSLIDTYGDEHEALQNINTERERSIELLDEEIKKSTRASRDEWIGVNDETIEKSLKKYYDVDNNIGRVQGKYLSSDIDIPQSVKDLLNIKRTTTQGNTYFKFSVDADNIEEQYKKIGDAIEILSNKKQSLGELNQYEQNLLDILNTKYKKLEKTIEEQSPVYSKYFSYTAQNKFEDYLTTDNGNIENIGKETYLAWKNGLLKTAENNDAGVRKELEQMAEKQFPDFAKYFNNLEKAKTFFIKDQYNDNLKNQIYSYISSLNEDDLSILLTFNENAFDEGIESVKRKISDFKKKNPIEVKFEITDYQEQLETVYGNIEKLQNAITKLDENKFDFSGDIKDLIKAFPEYTTEILNASGDTAQLRDVLQDLLDSQPNDLISSLNKLKKSLTSDEDVRAVDNLIKILKNSTTNVEILESLVQSFDDLSSAVSTFTKNQNTLTEAFKEQEKHGQLSADTIQSLTEAGYAQALVYDNVTGAVIINKQALEELNKQKQIEIELDLQKKETDLITAYDDERTKISELNKELAHTNSLRAQEIINELTALEVTHKLTTEQLAQIRRLKNSLNAPTFDNGKSSTKDEEPASVTQFKKDLAEKEHLLNTNQITEQEYYDWLDSESKRVYGNLKDYEEDLWKYDEQVYKWRQEQEEKLFDKKIENYKKLSDNALNKYVDSDGNELTVNASFDYARSQINSAITETQNRINELSLKTGFEDEIEELTSDLEDLYDTLDDINKKEIESQKNYISRLKDEYSDLMDEQIDQQKKLADSINEAYESQIDLIDKQIDAINKVSEAEERQKKILDAEKDVKEAMQELDKASSKKRLVLGLYGNYELKEDKTAVKEAKDNLAEKQETLDEAKQDEQISKLEEQKELLEEQKNNSKDYYDKVVADLEEQKSEREKQYDILVDIYEQLGGEKRQTSLNDSLVTKLTSNGDINKAVQGLTPTEMKQAITSGILTTDSNGNYAIDYSILDKNEQAVKDNTTELEKTKSELEKLNSSISGDTTQTDTSKVDMTKPHLDAEGYLVGADGKRILNDGKAIHAKSKADHDKDINVKNAVSGIGSSISKSFAGYGSFNELLTAMMNGEYTIPTAQANNLINSTISSNVGKNVTQATDYASGIVANNAPPINFTVNIEGSADEKTIQAMKTEISNTLIEYTNYMTNSMNTAILRQKNKS